MLLSFLSEDLSVLKNAPSVPPLSSDRTDETDDQEEEEIRQPIIDKIEVVESDEPLVEPIHLAEEPVVEPVQPKVEPVELKPEEKEFNDTPTKVAVTYKTEDKKEEITPGMPERVEPVSTESSSGLADAPRRSRRQGATSTKKKKKSKAKGCLVTVLVLLVLVAVGGYFGYGYVQDSLKPVDASSKDYVTVQIPDGANVQEIGSTLEKSGLVKHGLIFSLYAKYYSHANFTLQLFPLVFLYVAGTMKSIDNSLLEAAESMGSFGFKRIVTVVLPLLVPTLLAAALLVFMRAFSDFGTPMLIGEGYRTFPVLIYTQFISEVGGNSAFASALAIMAIT